MSTVSIHQLAKLFDRKPRRIQQLVKEGLPQLARGKYDQGKCFEWYVRYLHNKIEKKGDEFSGLNEQRLRGLRASAETRELELAQKKGELVKLCDVQRVWGDLILMTKARLLSIPPRLAIDVLGESSRVMMQAKIERAIKDALTQLADEGATYPETRR
jgi:phage terminase Nu1 subunit (DNA packaging protein)